MIAMKKCLPTKLISRIGACFPWKQKPSLKRFDSGSLTPLDYVKQKRITMGQFLNSEIPNMEFKEKGIDGRILDCDLSEKMELKQNIHNIVEESVANNNKTIALLLCTNDSHTTPVIIEGQKLILPLPPSHNSKNLLYLLRDFCDEEQCKLYKHPNLFGFISFKNKRAVSYQLSDFLMLLKNKQSIKANDFFDTLNSTHYQADEKSCGELAHQTIIGLCKNKNHLLKESIYIDIPEDLRKNPTIRNLVNQNSGNNSSVHFMLPMPDAVIPWSQSKKAIMGYRVCLAKLEQLFNRSDTQRSYEQIKALCKYFDKNIVKLLEQRQRKGVKYKGQIYGKEGLRRQRQERMQTINSQNVTP